jgi:hypothetical protein
MLAWHILETDAQLEFTDGYIIDKMAVYSFLEAAKSGDSFETTPEKISAANALQPYEDFEVDRRLVDGCVFVPVEAALWLEDFDWELGTAKGSLHHAVLFNPEAFQDVLGTYEDGWIELDLSGLVFPLSLIELLAPNASPPPVDLLSPKSGGLKMREGGPGRRRKHDWDGALMSLIGKAERNSIAADPEAHGAQADIADRLADWFASRDLPVPANSQLQERARDVLASIRAANP